MNHDAADKLRDALLMLSDLAASTPTQVDQPGRVAVTLPDNMGSTLADLMRRNDIKSSAGLFDIGVRAKVGRVDIKLEPPKTNPLADVLWPVAKVTTDIMREKEAAALREEAAAKEAFLKKRSEIGNGTWIAPDPAAPVEEVQVCDPKVARILNEVALDFLAKHGRRNTVSAVGLRSIRAFGGDVRLWEVK